MKQIRMSEKAWKRWIFTACILFFTIAAVTCHGQNTPMKFNHAEDTVYVGVDDGSVFAYFKHDRTTDYTLRIGYVNGSFEDLHGKIQGLLTADRLESGMKGRLK